MSWKRIADEMPPENTPVLCYGVNRFSDENVAVLSWRRGHNYIWWDLHGMGGYECECELEPTHWQPLPAAPEG